MSATGNAPRLFVDLGNSRLKWAWSTPEGEWTPGAVLHRGRALAPLLDEIWGTCRPPPVQVVVASVAASERCSALRAWLQAHWGLEPQMVQARAEQLGVRNGYREPATLGADRWAALIATRALAASGAACIVDCGTAVTVDALAASGEFLGGVILPGLDLQRASLREGTAGVRAPSGAPSCLGRTTGEAVAGGTLYGLAGAIERVLTEQEAALGGSGGGDVTVFLTGGDAASLLPLLRRRVTLVPDLVLRGLQRIAQEEEGGANA